MLVAGIIMILGGIYGIWAGYASKNSHISGFFGVMILSALLLMVSGVLGVALPLRIIVAGCGSTTYPVVAGLNITATQAIAFLCETCQCYVNSSNSNLTAGYNISLVDSSFPVKATSCTNWTTTAYDDTYASI